MKRATWDPSTVHNGEVLEGAMLINLQTALSETLVCCLLRVFN